VSGSNCFQDLQRKLLQVLEEAGVFACWFVVGRKEIPCNIGCQSMAFVHTIVISALMSPVPLVRTSVSEDTNFTDRHYTAMQSSLIYWSPSYWTLEERFDAIR
jgi:hypothetical protein